MPSLYLTKPLAADRALLRLRRDTILRVLAPLYEAVRDRKIVFYQTTDRDKAIPFGDFAQQRLPVLVILTDTTDGPNGPGRWTDAERISEWAGGVAHAYAEPVMSGFFQIIVEETASNGRFVLVETAGEMVNAWRRLFGGRPVKLRSVKPAGA